MRSPVTLAILGIIGTAIFQATHAPVQVAAATMAIVGTLIVTTMLRSQVRPLDRERLFTELDAVILLTAGHAIHAIPTAIATSDFVALEGIATVLMVGAIRLRRATRDDRTF